MKLLVITHVPDPEGSPRDAWGNLAAPLGELWVLESERGPLTRLERFRALPAGLSLSLRRKVFTVGELLVVDDDGREIGGRNRKPSKWGVGFSTFSLGELNEAIALVLQIITTRDEANLTFNADAPTEGQGT